MKSSIATLSNYADLLPVYGGMKPYQQLLLELSPITRYMHTYIQKDKCFQTKIRKDNELNTFSFTSLQKILHPVQDRVLSIRENARLQGFPDYYKLCGPVKERYPIFLYSSSVISCNIKIYRWFYVFMVTLFQIHSSWKCRCGSSCTCIGLCARSCFERFSWCWPGVSIAGKIPQYSVPDSFCIIWRWCLIIVVITRFVKDLMRVDYYLFHNGEHYYVKWISSVRHYYAKKKL